MHFILTNSYGIIEIYYSWRDYELVKKIFYKFFGKSERKIFDKSDLEYKDSDNT